MYKKNWIHRKERGKKHEQSELNTAAAITAMHIAKAIRDVLNGQRKFAIIKCVQCKQQFTTQHREYIVSLTSYLCAPTHIVLDFFSEGFLLFLLSLQVCFKADAHSNRGTWRYGFVFLPNACIPNCTQMIHFRAPVDFWRVSHNLGWLLSLISIFLTTSQHFTVFHHVSPENVQYAYFSK